MKCSTCSKSAAVHIRPLGPLCKKCFCRIIEKRIRKDARLKEWFKKNDHIYTDSMLSRCIVSSIVASLPKKFVKSRQSANKIVLTRTSEDIIVDSLEQIFRNKRIKSSCRKEIPLLCSLTDEEASAYAEFRKLNFRPRKKNREIKKFIDALQDRYQETKSALANAIEDLS